MLGGNRPHLRHRRVADVAWTADTAVPSGHHAVVPRRTQDNIPQRNVAQEIAVLSALWSGFPGLVCLPASDCVRLCVAVLSQQIQDHHV